MAQAAELDWLLERQHMVVSRCQALRLISSSAIERRVASKRWQAPHRGVYVAHSGPVDRQQRHWIAVLGTVAGRQMLLGGLSALETVGFRADVTHVLVPARMTPRNPPRAVVAHRTSRLRAVDVHRVGDPPGTMPARSLVDAAQWARSDHQARAILAAGFQQRLVGADELMPVLAGMPRARRRSLIIEAVSDGAAGAHTL